jgi:inward rectifier potassium channel
MRRRLLHDLYHQFMTVGWPTIFASFATSSWSSICCSRPVYSLQDRRYRQSQSAGYWGRFFFSVETFATVGYGDMHPQTPFAHVVAAIEIFIGLMSLALITGMMFARFSKPHGALRVRAQCGGAADGRQDDADAARRQCAPEHRHGSLGAAAAAAR